MVHQSPVSFAHCHFTPHPPFHFYQNAPIHSLLYLLPAPVPPIFALLGPHHSSLRPLTTSFCSLCPPLYSATVAFIKPKPKLQKETNRPCSVTAS